LEWAIAISNLREEKREREGELRNARRYGGSGGKVLGHVDLEPRELGMKCAVVYNAV
jgi:hypothetical protein